MYICKFASNENDLMLLLRRRGGRGLLDSEGRSASRQGVNKEDGWDDNPQTVGAPQVTVQVDGVVGYKVLVTRDPFRSKGHPTTVQLTRAQDDVQWVSPGGVGDGLFVSTNNFEMHLQQWRGSSKAKQQRWK